MSPRRNEKMGSKKRKKKKKQVAVNVPLRQRECSPHKATLWIPGTLPYLENENHNIGLGDFMHFIHWV